MSNVLTLEQQRDIVAKWQASPIVRHYSFSDKKLWGGQEKALWAYRNNKRTAIKSGNTVGKTTIAADIVNDWLFTHGPQAKVITTSSSWTQVEEVLWKEIRSFVTSSKIPLGAEILNTSLKLSDEWFAIGISTDTPVRFQGFHSPHLLILADEASGIAPEIWEMFEALHPEKIVALGNPLEANGPFFDCFSSNLWHKITISCLDCVEWQRINGKIPGLVSLEWVNEMADLHGRNSAWFRVHVLGEFPEQDEFALIERQWVDRARKGLDEDGLPLDDENESSCYRMIASDLASKHGNNETVIGYRYGHTLKDLKAFNQKTMTNIRDEIVGSYSAVEAHITGHDADGLGESMAELLSEMHIPCIEFHGGNSQKAMDTKFRNIRSQFYWIVAKKFEKGLYNLKHLPEKEFEILRSQLCSIRVKAPDPMGRFQIETKDDLMARQIKSPDYADMFVISEFLYFMRKMSELRPAKYGVL